MFTFIIFRFRVCSKTASTYFRRCVHVLSIILTDVVYWPERETLIASTPQCFREAFGTKVAVIIDCFEVFLERPNNMRSAAECWSSYKHHITSKVLIGIAPQSTVSYVSNGWAGRVSDKFLTEFCGVLDNILPGDLVLADRGFTVETAVMERGASLNIPAFTKGFLHIFYKNFLH